ncbi:hypothetical protein [Culicoidibacter larvae]|uniref:Uncharacterized protein n=1 Tax=Culicoidibacter larvae TaxID=2579976 RepID=A0A5R8QDN4_9FIRM|nr:hypothetical protein [Culicoidibacter larvae]TLG75375.1 hypothetical protein FEZ08_04820 [Culicoidibacter larvae]
MIYLTSGLLITALALIIAYVARITFRGSFVEKSGIVTVGKIRSVTEHKKTREIGVIFYVGSQKIETSYHQKNTNLGEVTPFIIGDIIELKYDKMHPQTIILSK